MNCSNYKDGISVLTPVEKENIEQEASLQNKEETGAFLNPDQLNKLAHLFQEEILPVMKAHEKEVESNPKLKASIEKQVKRQEARLVFRHMMAEVEDAIEKPGTPFAEKLKTYIGELEGIVNPERFDNSTRKGSDLNG